jgi:hypothetical protein
MSAVLVALAMLVVLTVPCAAQQSTKPLVVAWAELYSDALAEEFENVSVLIPQQLRAALYFIKERYPDIEEAVLALEKSRSNTVEAARTAIASSRAARDLIALTVRDADKRAMDLVNADKNVFQAENKLAEFLSEPPDEYYSLVETELARPVTNLVDQVDRILLAPVIDPVAVCAEKSIDLLVYGRIRQSGTFIIVELAVFNAALGRDIWNGTDYSAPDGLDLVVKSLARPVAEALLGKPYSLVTFVTSPPDTELLVGGKSINSNHRLFFDEGFHEYSAKAPGHEAIESFFSTIPGQDLTLEIKLSQLDSVAFVLESNPPGATIHLDGNQLGTAPANVEGIAYPRILRVSMPGFEDVQMTVRPESLLEDTIIKLQVSDGLSFDTRFDDKKSQFYRSLGLFVVSLPVTVLTGGLFQTYYAASIEADERYGYAIDTTLREFLNNRFFLTQTAFWISASVSVGFVVNAAFKLASYIGSAQ